MVGNVSIVRIKALQVWQILKSKGAGCRVFQGERQLSYGFQLGAWVPKSHTEYGERLRESDLFLARDDE